MGRTTSGRSSHVLARAGGRVLPGVPFPCSGTFKTITYSCELGAESDNADRPTLSAGGTEDEPVPHIHPSSKSQSRTWKSLSSVRLRSADRTMSGSDRYRWPRRRHLPYRVARRVPTLRAHAPALADMGKGTRLRPRPTLDAASVRPGMVSSCFQIACACPMSFS